MPHVDGALVSTGWPAPGQSRFARPVAAITAFVQRHLAAARELAVPRARPGAPADREFRQIEERHARARDAHDLERMQRAEERCDMRPWGWR